MNLEALNETYTPEVQTALARYKKHLDDARADLKQREEQAKMQLREYESCGKSMEDISERFAELQRAADVVRADVKRLGGEV